MTTLLFGGTFDPVHHGHLITAQAALEALGAKRCVFLPARISPHKMTGRSAAGPDRVAMLRRAIEGSAQFAVDDREFARSGPSYTIDTVTELQCQYPQEKYVLLMGSDQLAMLHTWHRVHELLDRVGVALLGRPGAELEAGLQAAHRTLGQAVTERLRAGVVAAPLIDISATVIRQRVGRGAPIRYLVPEAVERYISEDQLYR